jgi:hypothetical protein
MSRIDRAFSSIAWEDLHPYPVISLLSSSTSDHCPLKIHSQECPVLPPTFRFEAHWPFMSGFSDCVQQAWIKPIMNPQNAMLTLHI